MMITWFSEKLRFQNVFSPHKNAKLAFSDFSGLKNVFEKLCFPDISMWKVGLTTRKKAVFLNFSDVAWRGALENMYYIHGGASSESQSCIRFYGHLKSN